MDNIYEQIVKSADSTGFSGVVSLHLGNSSFFKAFGYREHANHIKNEICTRFAIASGTKGFTAIGVARLVEQGEIGLDTRVREVLGKTLSTLHPDITVAHLLGHTSGMGDYLDEENIKDIREVVLPIHAQDLTSPGDYVPLIEKEQQKFAPGERFSYSNGGYIVLAMMIEAVTRQPYHDFIENQVVALAGMSRSGFFRSDDLPADTAIGYLQEGNTWRSNVFSVPVRGCGDGGAYSTLDDMWKFWQSLKAFRLVNKQLLAELLFPRQYCEKQRLKYGYGFWVDDKAGQVLLEGYDAGVSFRSAEGLNGDDGYTVISNTSSGAWPMIHILSRYFQQGCEDHSELIGKHRYPIESTIPQCCVPEIPA